MSIRLASRLTGIQPTASRLSRICLHVKQSSSAHKMAPIPKTMKGVIIEKAGGVEVLEYRTNLPVPTPKEGEVLVKNELIGVNYIDT